MSCGLPFSKFFLAALRHGRCVFAPAPFGRHDRDRPIDDGGKPVHHSDPGLHWQVMGIVAVGEAQPFTLDAQGLAVWVVRSSAGALQQGHGKTWAMSRQLILEKR